MVSCERAAIVDPLQQPGEGEIKLDDSKHSDVPTPSLRDTSSIPASSVHHGSAPANTTAELARTSSQSFSDLLSTDTQRQASFQKYRSQEDWDLIISTATEDFRVHKSVLCAASPFFKAACEGAFMEAHTGIVHLSESAEIVYSMLRHIYYWGGFEDLPYEMHHLVELHLAADKVSSWGLREVYI